MVGASAPRTGTRCSWPDRRSATSIPASLLEMDLHGGGIDARGAALPGCPGYVLIGRGQDFAWSAHLGRQRHDRPVRRDALRHDTRYRYKGRCRPHGTFDAGTLAGGCDQRERSRSRRPFTDRSSATRRWAASASRSRRERSSRGRDVLRQLAFQDLNVNRPRSPASSCAWPHPRVHLQLVLRGRPRHRGVLERAACRSQARRGPGPADVGTGRYEWRGFLPAAPPPAGDQPAQRRDPELEQQAGAGLRRGGRPTGATARFTGSCSRTRLAKRRKHTLTSVVAAMNEAATPGPAGREGLRRSREVLRRATCAADSRARAACCSC